MFKPKEYFILHSPIAPVTDPVVLNKGTRGHDINCGHDINSSQATAAPYTDTSYSQENINVVYENMAEQSFKIDADRKYILTKCPAYEPCQPAPNDHNHKRTAP